VSKSPADELNAQIESAADESTDLSADEPEQSFEFDIVDLVLMAMAGHATIKDGDEVIDEIKIAKGESPQSFTRRALDRARDIDRERQAAVRRAGGDI